MLVFSSGIILYGTLFRSPETKLLLSMPARDERITIHKFQEALAYSCWGFFLLASPMMLAYGVVVVRPVVLLRDDVADDCGVCLHSL